jgi:hypothetical protein
MTLCVLFLIECNIMLLSSVGLLVYAALGELYATMENTELAWQHFNDAAEAAMAAGKPKLANKHMESASMYE